jgi:uncharacterized protein YdhG (YjbR/CyaY superfamily)
MFSVLELRSQIELWEQYFQDSKSEIQNLQGELTWYQVNNTTREAAIQVEHFQNQFFLQQQIIGDISRQLRISARLLIRKDPKAILEENYLSSINSLAEQMETFQKLYGDLKEEFREVVLSANLVS